MYAFWTGFHVVEFRKETINLVDTYTDKWQWLDNSPIDYLNWANSWDGRCEPDFFLVIPRTNKSCAVLLADYNGADNYLNAIKTQWFDDANCNSIYTGAICQQDSDIKLDINNHSDSNLSCDEGWTRFELTNVLNERYNMCYKYVYENNIDYFGAKNRCDAMNSSMFNVENESELEFLLTLPNPSDVNSYPLFVLSVELARSLPEANQTFFALWIGLVQLDRSYDWTFGWKWLDGSVVDFLDWARLMPKARVIISPKDSYTYNQDPGCAILVANATNEVYRIHGVYYPFDYTSFWVDVDLIQKSCNSIFSGVICQQDSSYAIYNPNKMVWQEAADACASMNASLATIENQEEHEFMIRDLIQYSYTLPAYTIWLERITDDCNYQILNWQSIYGSAGSGPRDFIGIYQTCCDASQKWTGDTASEYFNWGDAEPVFYFGKACPALDGDGFVSFSFDRYHGMFVEFCEYPSVGAVCKKKPSKNPLVKSKNIANENVKIPVQSEGYSATYKSTLSPEAFQLTI
uniref:C-type lectin domain-containing protein n=1 Tax=Acrobeloides nanus TaxID=290746 RepID=A0A914DHB2_9BILA